MPRYRPGLPWALGFCGQVMGEPGKQVDRAVRSWLWRDRPVYLMVSLMLLLLLVPILQNLRWAGLLVHSFFTIMFVASVAALMSHRRVLIAVVVTLAPSLVLTWLGYFVEFATAMLAIRAAAVASFLLVILVAMVVHVMKATVVTGNTLCRAVSAYMVLGILWSQIYLIVVCIDPSAISRLAPESPWVDYMYFSLTCLTTLGFGDITPISQQARSLATLEALVGPLYLTILVARLVGLQSRSNPGDQRGGKPPSARDAGAGER